MAKPKLSRTPQLDIEKCVKNSGGNKFDMIIHMAQRAKEIAKKNRGNVNYVNAPMNALFELQEKTHVGDKV